MIKHNKGFSLLELILVLGVGTAIAFIKFQDMKGEQENMTASAVGSQIKQVGEAVNRYISIRFDKLSTLSTSSNQSSDPGPRNCSTANNSCTITYQTLINEGLLPASYNGINVNRSAYSIVLRRSGNAPDYVINGLVMTTEQWKEGDRIRYDLLGKSMQTAGIDSGVSKLTSTVSGYGGQWSEKASDYNNITSTGLLAYRVGYNSAMYSVYLRRDGTLPMTGDLNMGTKNIYNADNITASGKGTFGGEVEAGAWVHARNGYGDLLSIGGDALANDYEIRMDADKPLGIHMKSNRSDITVLKITGGVEVVGELNTTGNITSGRNIAAGNWLIAHNGGGNTMYIGGDASGVVNGTAGNDYEIKMDTAKPLTIWNTAMSDRTQNMLEVWGTQQITGNLSVAASGDANGTITASGNITSNNTVYGKYLSPTENVAVGDSCAENGLIGKTSAGRTVSCINNIWKNQISIIDYQEINAVNVADRPAYAGCATAIVNASKVYTTTINTTTEEIFSTSLNGGGADKTLNPDSKNNLALCVFVNNALCSADTNIKGYASGNASCIKKLNKGTNTITWVVGHTYGLSRFLIQYTRFQY
ncbi:type II secretion system protein [Cedecea neteri]|uniref:Prepilin-type cleavage/methylation domain-containing protein n=1 Tax=Cedecea neteri TaxID=158822 RepID=A0A291DZW0_9ENTR|nr:hypothetical protein [Cedecea neteri]ATF93355.1 prepilin-type cleavage/methylation domain-containing protein [Cedecea neteri]